MSSSQCLAEWMLNVFRQSLNDGSGVIPKVIFGQRNLSIEGR